MLIHADLSQPVFLTPGDRHWVDSPIMGVQRQLLDRIGTEVARATSLVRYAPGSRFPRHVHGGGEEILVLSGVFEDDTGLWPAGSYLRNPAGSAHAPGSTPGCLLFVKLHQFQPDDDHSLRLHIDQASPWPAPRVLLHAWRQEQISLQALAAGDVLTLTWPAGGEVLVLAGALDWDGRHWPALSWMRWPAGTAAVQLQASSATQLYIHRGLVLR